MEILLFEQVFEVKNLNLRYFIISSSLADFAVEQVVYILVLIIEF